MSDVVAGAVAPVAPAVPAPGAQPVNPAPDAPAVVDAPPQEGAEPVKSDEMIPKAEVGKIVSDRLTKERRRLERTLRAELKAEMLERQLQERQAPAPSEQPQGEPQPEQFKTPQEYVRALVRWERKQEASQSEQQTRAQQERQHVTQEAEYVQAKLSEASEVHPGLDERLIADDMPLTRPMADFVFEAEHGYDVGNYLTEHKDEARKISNLTPANQILALNEIRLKLKAPPPQSKLPPPIKPNSGNAASDTGYRPEMTDKQYAEWRARQKAAKQK